MTTNLKALRASAEEYAADCADAKATLRTFKFYKDNQMVFAPDGGMVGMTGKFNDWSFNQLCFKMNVPAGWVGNQKNCPEELKIKILDDLAGKYRDDANMLIRMKGEVIRAVLSSQYAQFDNLEFIDLIAEAVSTMGIEPQVHRVTVDDDMRGYIVFPQITIAPDPTIKGEPPHGNGGLHPSLYVSNSERGGGSARVVGAVYRSICTNGVIFGWKEQDSFQLRHRFHSRAMMASLVAEGIAEALHMSEEATKKFIAAQDVKVPQVSLAGLVDKWAGQYGITVEAKGNWMTAIATETIINGRKDDTRLFDIVNAATYVAQTIPAAEMEMMERMAGDLLRGHADYV